MGAAAVAAVHHRGAPGVRAELGRRGEDPDAVAVSFVKVVELQARAIPHYHTVIRLDAPATDSDGTVAPPQTSITAAELAALVQAAAHRVRLEVAAGEGRSRVLRLGERIDTQPLSAATGADPDGVARRVAGYLAKYVTKSVADFGLWPARISPQACASLEVSAHVRGILNVSASTFRSSATATRMSSCILPGRHPSWPPRRSVS